MSCTACVPSRPSCHFLLDLYVPARMQSTGTGRLSRNNKHTRLRASLGCADVPQQRAAAMTLGVVAGRARGALVDACAAYRARDSQARAWAPRHAMCTSSLSRRGYGLGLGWVCGHRSLPGAWSRRAAQRLGVRARQDMVGRPRT